MRPVKELARSHADGSPGTLIRGRNGEMGGQLSLATYYRSILMCSVLCQFFFILGSVHDMILMKKFGSK